MSRNADPEAMEKDEELHNAPAAAGTNSNEVMILEESNVERYQRFKPIRKKSMVIMVAYATFQVPFTTTSILPCVPEISKTFRTTQEVVNGTNAISSVFMALSPLIFGPLTEIYGRKPLMVICAVLFACGNLVTSLAPNLPVFVVFRCINFFGGTSFFSMGASIVGDLYEPTKRATAMSWVLFGSQIGPALGPIIGGAIVTYTSWRILFWVQFAMSGLLIPLFLFLLPETAYYRKIDDIKRERNIPENKFLLVKINPFSVLALLRFPNLVMAAIISASAIFNMYVMLTPIRKVMDPRFGLTTPILSALFYLPTAAGLLTGTFIGGKWADHTVKKWIKRRGRRMPEDRVRSLLVPLGVVMPITTIIYGWVLEYEKGGYAVPILCMFFCGVAQTVMYASINTYCVDSTPKHGSGAISGNYSMRYVSQAIGIGTCLPMINGIGVGGTMTVASGFLWIAAVSAVLLVLYGEKWRIATNEKDAKREAKHKASKKNAKAALQEQPRESSAPATKVTTHDLDNSDVEEETSS